jgi:dihydrodipicolinate synthase/N-acetylneuraminate lyase
MADEPKEGWMVSAKMLVSMVASAMVILGTVLGGCGWVIGLYNGMDKRLTIVEASNARMGDDIRDIKTMLSQLMMNRADNRPDMQRWAK